MIHQNTHGSSRTFLISNFLFFSVSFSPVGGSETDANLLVAIVLNC